MVYIIRKDNFNTDNLRNYISEFNETTKVQKIPSFRFQFDIPSISIFKQFELSIIFMWPWIQVLNWF
jgi:hypothetical protein